MAFDNVSNSFIVFRVAVPAMSVDVINVIPNTFSSTSFTPDIIFLAEDILFLTRGGGPQNYAIFDFNPTSGSIGTQWTPGANMPAYTYDHGVVGTHKAMAAIIPGSSFAMFWYTDVNIAWYPKTDSDLYSFSLNKVTKVYGENLNTLPTSAKGASTRYGIFQININPALESFTLSYKGPVSSSDTPYYLRAISLEKATGVFGLVGPELSTYHSEIGYRPMHKNLWSEDGLTLYNFINGYSHGMGSSESILWIHTFDPILNTFTAITKTGTLPGNTGLRTDHQFFHDGYVFFVTAGGTVSQGKINGGVTEYHGFYGFGDFAVGSYKLAFAINGYLIVIQDHGTVDGSKPSVYFWKIHKVKNNSLEFVSPLASGVLLTADYHTSYIPKDSNHILDLEITYAFTGG
jgi:hypothetical protein